jgi:peroxiredoxin Q/BCP
MAKNIIDTGSPAPDFTLKDQTNKDFSLNSVLKQSNIVLYFYPKDETPVCTTQACEFRDRFAEFRNVNAVVIGVSADSPESHAAFAKHHGLGFTLLSDTDGKIRKLYGVDSQLFGLMPGRVTFVIDKQGIVRHRFSSQLMGKKHIEEALKSLEKI